MNAYKRKKTAPAIFKENRRAWKVPPQQKQQKNKTGKYKRQTPFTESLPLIHIERQILVFASYDDFALKLKTALRIHVYSDDKQHQKHEGERDTDRV